MKRILVITSLAALMYSCGGNEPKKAESDEKYDSKEMFGKDEKSATATVNPEHEKKGVGKYSNIELPAKLDVAMAEKGNSVYEMKCSGCHKLTSDKLVGPGWKGVTSRRDAAWVMNFVTNTDEMLNKDAAAMAMLEECLVRMPNQNLSEADARAVYELMRKNDGVK